MGLWIGETERSIGGYTVIDRDYETVVLKAGLVAGEEFALIVNGTHIRHIRTFCIRGGIDEVTTLEYEAIVGDATVVARCATADETIVE